MADKNAHNPLEGERPSLVLDLNDGTEELVSIIIVHKDRPQYLNMCLQSIAVTSINNNYEVIVVDNASGQESQDFFKEIENDVKLVRNKKNVYWSAAVNAGVAAADKNSKYLILMHCDCVILNNNWIDIFVNVSQSQNCGLVGLDMASYSLDGQKIDFIPEWCMLVTRECWNEIGGFNEKLPAIGHSFIFTRKAQNLGHKPQIMKNQIVHHYHCFSYNISEHERLIEEATANLPGALREIMAQPIVIK